MGKATHKGREDKMINILLNENLLFWKFAKLFCLNENRSFMFSKAHAQTQRRQLLPRIEHHLEPQVHTTSLQAR